MSTYCRNCGHVWAEHFFSRIAGGDPQPSPDGSFPCSCTGFFVGGERCDCEFFEAATEQDIKDWEQGYD